MRVNSLGWIHGSSADSSAFTHGTTLNLLVFQSESSSQLLARLSFCSAGTCTRLSAWVWSAAGSCRAQKAAGVKMANISRLASIKADAAQWRFPTRHLHVKFCHFSGRLAQISHASFISYPPQLVSSLFVLLSLCKCAFCSVGALPIICVWAVSCLLKGSLRRTPLWWNNHENAESRLACPFHLPLFCIHIIFLIFHQCSFTSFSSCTFKCFSPPVCYFDYIWQSSRASSSHLVCFMNRIERLACVTKMWVSSSSCA